MLFSIPFLAALTLARAHQAVFNPAWVDRQSAFGFGSNTDNAPLHPCSGVCLLTPEQMEGPFYLPYALHRANLTEGRPGIPLQLTLTVYDVSASTGNECVPLRGAWVDIWEADYEGVYSGYGKEAEDAPSQHAKRDWNAVVLGRRSVLPPPGHVPPINDQTFLRGVQKTDSRGQVTFHTLYPGWYPGRTTHIHLKVHAPEWHSTGHSKTNTTHAHTTQLYFSEDLNARVATLPPYRDNTARRTRNEEDFLYRQIRGAGTLTTRIEGRIDDGDEERYPSGFIRAERAIGIDKWW